MEPVRINRRKMEVYERRGRLDPKWKFTHGMSDVSSLEQAHRLQEEIDPQFDERAVQVQLKDYFNL